MDANQSKLYKVQNLPQKRKSKKLKLDNKCCICCCLSVNNISIQYCQHPECNGVRCPCHKIKRDTNTSNNLDDVQNENEDEDKDDQNESDEVETISPEELRKRNQNANKKIKAGQKTRNSLKEKIKANKLTISKTNSTLEVSEVDQGNDIVEEEVNENDDKEQMQKIDQQRDEITRKKVEKDNEEERKRIESEVEKAKQNKLEKQKLLGQLKELDGKRKKNEDENAMRQQNMIDEKNKNDESQSADNVEDHGTNDNTVDNSDTECDDNIVDKSNDDDIEDIFEIFEKKRNKVSRAVSIISQSSFASSSIDTSEFGPSEINYDEDEQKLKEMKELQNQIDNVCKTYTANKNSIEEVLSTIENITKMDNGFILIINKNVIAMFTKSIKNIKTWESLDENNLKVIELFFSFLTNGVQQKDDQKVLKLVERVFVNINCHGKLLSCCEYFNKITDPSIVIEFTQDKTIDKLMDICENENFHFNQSENEKFQDAAINILCNLIEKESSDINDRCYEFLANSVSFGDLDNQKRVIDVICNDSYINNPKFKSNLIQSIRELQSIEEHHSKLFKFLIDCMNEFEEVFVDYKEDLIQAFANCFTKVKIDYLKHQISTVFQLEHWQNIDMLNNLLEMTKKGKFIDENILQHLTNILNHNENGELKSTILNILESIAENKQQLCDETLETLGKLFNDNIYFCQVLNIFLLAQEVTYLPHELINNVVNCLEKLRSNLESNSENIFKIFKLLTNALEFNSNDNRFKSELFVTISLITEEVFSNSDINEKLKLKSCHLLSLIAKSGKYLDNFNYDLVLNMWHIERQIENPLQLRIYASEFVINECSNSSEKLKELFQLALEYLENDIQQQTDETISFTSASIVSLGCQKGLQIPKQFQIILLENISNEEKDVAGIKKLILTILSVSVLSHIKSGIEMNEEDLDIIKFVDEDELVASGSGVPFDDIKQFIENGLNNDDPNVKKLAFKFLYQSSKNQSINLTSSLITKLIDIIKTSRGLIEGEGVYGIVESNEILCGAINNANQNHLIEMLNLILNDAFLSDLTLPFIRSIGNVFEKYYLNFNIGPLSALILCQFFDCPNRKYSAISPFLSILFYETENECHKKLSNLISEIMKLERNENQVDLTKLMNLYSTLIMNPEDVIEMNNEDDVVVNEVDYLTLVNQIPILALYEIETVLREHNNILTDKVVCSISHGLTLSGEALLYSIRSIFWLAISGQKLPTKIINKLVELTKSFESNIRDDEYYIIWTLVILDERKQNLIPNDVSVLIKEQLNNSNGSWILSWVSKFCDEAFDYLTKWNETIKDKPITQIKVLVGLGSANFRKGYQEDGKKKFDEAEILAAKHEPNLNKFIKDQRNDMMTLFDEVYKPSIDDDDNKLSTWQLSKKGKLFRQECKFDKANNYFKIAFENYDNDRLKEELEITSESKGLFEMLVKYSNIETAKKQLNNILEKLDKFNRKKVIEYLRFMTERDKHFNESTTEIIPINNWKFEFLKSEIVSRSIGKTSKEASDNLKFIDQFEESWSSFISFTKRVAKSNPEIQQNALDKINLIIKFQKKSVKMAISLVDISQFFKLVQVNENVNSIEKHESLTSLMKSFRKVWFLKRKREIKIEDNQIDQVWEFFKNQPFEDNLMHISTFLESIDEPTSGDEFISYLYILFQTEVDIKTLLNTAQNCQRNEKIPLIKLWQSEIELNVILQKLQNIKRSSQLRNFPSIDSSFKTLLYMQQNKLINFFSAKLLIKKFEIEFKEKPISSLADSFSDSISIIYRYKLLESGENIDEVIRCTNESQIIEWPQKLHELALKLRFQESSTKDLENLLQELKQVNGNKVDDVIENNIKKIFDNNGMISKFSNLYKKINEWTIDDIKSWSKTAKSAFQKIEIEELIAVISQGVKLHTTKMQNDITIEGYSLRKIQIISLLLLLRGVTGRLAKISTGEGKSTIIAMLAVIKSLSGLKVDIVTSSPLLAVRDAEVFSKFYEMFNLTVADNSGSSFKRNAKLCYTKDIVYGDSSTFEADILRHEYSLDNTRGNRGFGAVIVDEVDSMFIDHGGHSTHLVDQMPAMEHLEPVLIFVWTYFNSIYDGLLRMEQHYYKMEQKECGNENQLAECLFKLLPEHSKQFGNTIIANSEQLKDYLQLHAKHTFELLSEIESKRNIATLIRKGEIDYNCASEDFVNELSLVVENCEIIDENHQIVEKYTKDLVRFDDSNLPILLARATNFHIRIYILDNNGQINPISKYGYMYDDSVKKPIELLSVDGKLYLLQKCEDMDSFFKEEVSKHVRKIITLSEDDCKDKKKIKIPKHLWELVERKLEVWIKSAFVARFRLKENQHYIIQEQSDGYDSVKPVDAENTGVVQENTSWSDGLHQMVQINRKLKITSQSFTSNFMSNMIFFKRYKTNIYGLTGTLGSEAELELLKHLYGVDTVDIPTYKAKQYYQLQSTITLSNEDWLSSITQNILQEANFGRSVLVICRTIADANFIEKRIKSKDANAKIELYTRSDKQQDAVKEEFAPGTIMIATNLAGRGTDIKLHGDVIKRGGLHVCITFLPTNSRVQQQAEGRTSRQGQPGTSEIIINTQNEKLVFDILKEKANVIQRSEVNELVEYKNMIDSIKLTPVIIEVMEKRNNEEMRITNNIQDETSKRLLIEEEVFQKYCQLRNSLMKKGYNSESKIGITMSAIDEKWAIKFDEVFHNWKPEYKDAKSKIDNFLKQIETEVKNRNVINNPCYFIQKGNRFNEKKKFDKALQQYEKAINSDKYFCENAYYNKAFSIIKKQKENYKEDAKKALEKCKELIEDELIPILLTSQGFLINQVNQLKEESANELKSTTKDDYKNEDETDFERQIKSKLGFYQLQLKSICDSLNEMEKYKDVIAKMQTINEYYKDSPINDKLSNTEMNELRASGFCGFLKIEKAPPPWLSIAAVFAVAGLQIILGFGLIALTGVGATVGPVLIQEGISDIIKGIQAVITGEFSWKDYLKEKAISLAFVLTFMAVSYGFKYAKPFIVKTFTKVGSSQFMTRSFTKIRIFMKPVTKHIVKACGAIAFIIQKARNSFNSILKFASEKANKLWEWTIKMFGTKAFKGEAGKILMANYFKDGILISSKIAFDKIAAQGLNMLMDGTVIKPIMVNFFMPRIYKMTRDELSTRFKNVELNEIISKIISKVKNGEKRIEEAAKEILRNNQGIADEILQIATGIAANCNNVLSQSLKSKRSVELIKQFLKATATGLLINSTEMIQALHKIKNLIPKFTKELITELKNIIKNEEANEKLISCNNLPSENRIAEIKEFLWAPCSELISDKICKIIEEGITRNNVNHCVRKFHCKMNNVLSKQLDEIRSNTKQIKDSIKVGKSGDSIGGKTSTGESKQNVSNSTKNEESDTKSEQNKLWTLTGILNRGIELYTEIGNGRLIKTSNYDIPMDENAIRIEPIRILRRRDGTYDPIVIDEENNFNIGIHNNVSDEVPNSKQTLMESIIISGKVNHKQAEEALDEAESIYNKLQYKFIGQSEILIDKQSV